MTEWVRLELVPSKTVYKYKAVLKGKRFGRSNVLICQENLIGHHCLGKFATFIAFCGLAFGQRQIWEYLPRGAKAGWDQLGRDRIAQRRTNQTPHDALRLEFRRSHRFSPSRSVLKEHFQSLN